MSKTRLDAATPYAPLQPDRLPQRPSMRGMSGVRPLVVFDLDGTLVDTAPDLAASLNHCLALADLPAIGLDAVRPNAGLGARVMLEHAYAVAGWTLDAAALAEQTACFLAYYEANICVGSALFEGALGALDRLAGSGFLLAVCTNKYEHLAEALLAALGIRERFAAVCGADTFQRRKPDPVHLLGTIEAAGGDPRRSVMIGDTRTDLDAAWAAGIPSILVEFGYGSEPGLGADADEVIAGFDALDAGLVHRLMAATMEYAEV